jgi:2-dehydro-3-deoxyphosphooctonate aldolase (KDO 8-P synthase)
VLVCDRGTFFGYGDLIVDPRGLVMMRAAGCPVVQDVTHAVQRPGALGTSTGGNRELVPTIARAAVAVGVRGLFFEVHDDPDKALSDGPNNFPVAEFEQLLIELKGIAAATSGLRRAYTTDANLPGFAAE